MLSQGIDIFHYIKNCVIKHMCSLKGQRVKNISDLRVQIGIGQHCTQIEKPGKITVTIWGLPR